MHLNVAIRPARTEDRKTLINVEAGATPNLSYVGHVFDMFLSDPRGEFSVAEVDGQVVACGKFTVLPDGSAWLETIRVLPDFQGMGIGKRFYQRFFEIAEAETVTTMRMYTGTKNAVSRGLAERFGFQLAETFSGAQLDLPHDSSARKTNFQPVTDPAKAAELILPQADAWKHFLVMNRTFYKLTSPLCGALIDAGQLYVDEATNSAVAIGARFMPEAAYHIGFFDGDVAACLDLARQLAIKANTQHLSCLFPRDKTKIRTQLVDYGFQLKPAEFIVMERHLQMV